MNAGPDPLDPKYATGAEQARQDVMVGVSVVMTFFGVIVVGCRIYTRCCVVRKVGPEDWIMVAAATLTVALLLQLIAGAKEFLLGFSALHLTPEQMVGNIKLILAVVVTYKTIVTLIKISILLMYLRLALNQLFQILCKATIALLIGYQIIVIIIVPAQCTPLKKLWDFSGQVRGHCINANAFYHATSAFHILMDMWILVLPLRLILKTPRPSREKLALYIIFGLGIVSMIASIVRLQSLRIFTLSKDPFYDSLPINTWSMVEVNIGMICASIPTLKPLASKFFRQCNDSDTSSESDMPILKTGKDLMISLHPTTLKGGMKTVDEEWELHDRPPPPPPKDEKFKVVRFDTRRYANRTDSWI